MNNCVYRFFDRDGVLLYVGLTNHLPGRIREHQESKSWWRHVTRVTVDHYPTRTDAAQAEDCAIRAEHPRYNIKGRPFTLDVVTWEKLVLVEPSLADLEDLAFQYDSRNHDGYDVWYTGDAGHRPFKRIVRDRVGWNVGGPCRRDYQQAADTLGLPDNEASGQTLGEFETVSALAERLHRDNCPPSTVHPIVGTSVAYDVALKYWLPFLCEVYLDREEVPQDYFGPTDVYYARQMTGLEVTF